MNTSYVYQSAQVGEFKVAVLTAKGPTSVAAAGDPVYNPGAMDFINVPFSALTQSGNYEVKFFPTTAGQIRAGAPNASQSGWTALWLNSGRQGVIVTQNATGTGMTPGTYPISFSGGTGGGAAGTVTVSATAVTAVNITNAGSYTSAPTATIGGSPGGTPATLTVALAGSGGPVAVGTNLSAETVQFGAFISEL